MPYILIPRLETRGATLRTSKVGRARALATNLVQIRVVQCAGVSDAAFSEWPQLMQSQLPKNQENKRGRPHCQNFNLTVPGGALGWEFGSVGHPAPRASDGQLTVTAAKLAGRPAAATVPTLAYRLYRKGPGSLWREAAALG
jgi:hypothetical protein